MTRGGSENGMINHSARALSRCTARDSTMPGNKEPPVTGRGDSSWRLSIFEGDERNDNKMDGISGRNTRDFREVE